MWSNFLEILREYRNISFRYLPNSRLKSAEEAVHFVDERGFISFWPITGIPLPSLWGAVAGDRPVPDNHDDPGQITWTWKDGLLGKKRWYYGRVLAHRNSIISLRLLPYFYALSPNYGDYQHDYLDQYALGAMTLEAKMVYEALLREGPLDTLALRKAARMTSPDSESRFKRALDTLQMEFKVLPVGISTSGAWHYAFIYDLVPRHFPDLEQQTRGIDEKEARKKLVMTYLEGVGAAPANLLKRIFGWNSETITKIIACLEENLLLVSCEENNQVLWVSLPNLWNRASSVI